MILPETVLQDLRYAVRLLVRNAGSTVLTVLALALGIGINTAGFTAYKAMVARPLDARAPTEMVNLALMRDSSATNYTFSYPDYEAYRDSVHSFSGLVAFRPARVTLSNAGGLLSQRTSAAGSGIGSLGLLRFPRRAIRSSPMSSLSPKTTSRFLESQLFTAAPSNR